MFYSLDIQAAVVYSCVTLGVTDSLVLTSLGIPLPRSVSHSCICYYFSYINLLGIPLPRCSQDSIAECFTSIEYTRYSRVHICFGILVANASIDLTPRRILEYLSEAIRLKYVRYGPYIGLQTSNISSIGFILSYTVEYYAF